MAVFAWVKSRTLFSRISNKDLEETNDKGFSRKFPKALTDSSQNSNKKFLETISKGGIWLS